MQDGDFAAFVRQVRGHHVADAPRVPVAVVVPDFVEDAALGERQGAAVLEGVQGFGCEDQGVVAEVSLGRRCVGGEADYRAVFV